MTKTILALTLGLAVLAPVASFAQSADASYCKALSEKYETYVAPMAQGRSPIPGSVDGNVAVDQCKSGNTAAAIPVLERKLQNARIDLPPRG